MPALRKRPSTSVDPLAFINDYQKRFKVAQIPGLPRFCGGLVGYFGYETVRYIERRLATTKKTDTLNLPDIVLLLSTELVAFDNVRGRLYFIVYADPAVPDAFRRAQERLAELKRKLRQPIEPPPNSVSATFERGKFGVRRRKLQSGGKSRQAIHLRRRLHASGVEPALESKFDASPLTFIAHCAR